MTRKDWQKIAKIVVCFKFTIFGQTYSTVLKNAWQPNAAHPPLNGPRLPSRVQPVGIFNYLV